MKPSVWLILFLVDLAAELLAISQEWHTVRFATKPLLLTFLLVYFLQQSNDADHARHLVSFALFFSWLGDVLLLLESLHPLYFIGGLSAFLVAHVLYILFFLRVRKKQNNPPAWNIIIIVAASIYGAALFFFLNPHLGKLQAPVLVYAITICTMMICAAHAFAAGFRKAALYCIAGAVLFIASDSLLAINKFHTPFSIAPITIMLTYALAQWAIAEGALQYLKTTKTSF